MSDFARAMELIANRDFEGSWTWEEVLEWSSRVRALSADEMQLVNETLNAMERKEKRQ